MNDDLISRQAAIDALEELKELDYELYIRTSYSHLMEDQWDFVIKRYKEAIKETPCAQQKTGRWIMGTTQFLPEYVCTNCKSRFPLVASEGKFYSKLNCANMNFCPNCGAKMGGDGNENG